jgi:transposase
MALILTAEERAELERRLRSLKIRAEDARRARVILMLADGASYSMIETTVPCFRDYINRWRKRFLVARLDGLRPRYRGQPPRVLTPAMEARILEKTRQAPSDGSTHWSTRKLGRELKIHYNLVGKAWRRAGLQPHRFARYMQSDDPDFETKAADVISQGYQSGKRAAASSRSCVVSCTVKGSTVPPSSSPDLRYLPSLSAGCLATVDHRPLV